MKRPLLLLHGALGSKKQLKSLKDILSKERETYSMDFEGHGDNTSNSDFNLTLFKSNILSFLEKNNLSKVDIFGYSMGGYVALDLALHHPELLGKIITLGTKFDWNPEFAEREIKMLNPSRIQEKVPKFADGLKKLHGSGDWQKVVLKTATFMKNLGLHPVLQKTALQSISHPVLICLGALDKMSTIEESKEVAGSLQNGEFKLLDEVKHPIEAVPVEELASTINSFLDKN